MVLGIYNNLTESELLAMRTNVLAQLTAARSGKRFSATAGHGRSYQKDNLSYDQLVQEVAEINYSLKRIDPKKYGMRTRMLQADFSRS